MIFFIVLGFLLLLLVFRNDPIPMKITALSALFLTAGWFVRMLLETFRRFRSNRSRGLYDLYDVARALLALVSVAGLISLGLRPQLLNILLWVWGICFVGTSSLLCWIAVQEKRAGGRRAKP